MAIHILSALREGLSLLSLWLPRSRISIYDLISTRNLLAEKTLYLNLGYWDGSTTCDDACRRLAEVVGEIGSMSPADEVVDCGFGFADQDFYWLERFKPRRITGLNITVSQVVEARRRAAECGISSARLDLREGSATAMPLADASADLVTALEAAFHFDTREAFFREAFRVLRPGGRLVTADILPRTDAVRTLKAAVLQWLFRRIWQVPAANVYDRCEYERKLSESGFVSIRVDSIHEKVYRPLFDFVRRRLRDADIKARVSVSFRLFYALGTKETGAIGPDYILSVSVKPEEKA
jgi:ubiquinone/menaquinone biosynthesis C-methylase UbiE